MTTLKIGWSIKKVFETINENFKELLNSITPHGPGLEIVWSGSATIPGRSDETETTVITMSDGVNLTNYDGLMFIREDTTAAVIMVTPAVGTLYKPINSRSDFDAYWDGMNVFMCNAEITATNEITLSKNVYSGVSTSKTARYITSFDEVPMTKIIGIKLN